MRKKGKNSTRNTKIEFVIAAVIMLFVLFLVFMILGQKMKTLKSIRKDQDIICAVSKEIEKEELAGGKI